MDDIWDIVRSIPPGRVATYGDVGAALKNPMSGFLVGRRLQSCPDGVPWWRVVAKDGTLPIWKLDPTAEDVQAERLRSEGVEVVDGRIDMAHFRYMP